MPVRKNLRWLGVFLVLAGLIVISYAGLTYYQTAQAEKQAEARIPDAPGAAVLLPTLTPEPPTDTPTPPPTDVPTSTPQPTTPAPTATPTIQMVVDSKGLPKGLGVPPMRIVVPRMRLDTKVTDATWDVVNENGQQVSEWQIPYDGVGHLKTTADPGEAGNAVISGHNNLIGPNIFGVGKFAGLWNLQVGDPVYITDMLGRTFMYKVASFYHVQELGMPEAVRVQHAQDMLADNGQPIVTLETCWNGPQAPLSGNTYRWVVRAALIGTVDSSQIPQVNPSQ